MKNPTKTLWPSPGQELFDVFVSVPRNLEALFLEECAELGLKGFRARPMGATARLKLPEVYRLVYQSRIASRVMRPIAELRDWKGPEEFYKAAMTLPWETLIPASKTFAIVVSVRDSVLTHSQYAGQLLKDAICDRNRSHSGARPSVDRENPQILIDLRIRGAVASLSVHYSTQAMFRRAYRRAAVAAPLKENLAHAVLRFAQWEPGSSLVDLCVGSGTLLLEAAMWASQTPAGYYKDRQGFEDLPDFDPKLWAKVKDSADRRRSVLSKGRLAGVDIDYDALDAARENLEFAGFGEQVRVLRRNCLDFAMHGHPLVVANLPYGERLSEEKELFPFYRDLGRHLTQQIPGGRAVLMASNPILERNLKLNATRRLMIDNGDLDVAVTEYQC